MNPTLTIAVDAMSGDAGAPVIVEAAEIVLNQHHDVHLILVGNEQELESCLAARPLRSGAYSIQPASEVVTMEDSAAVAMRQKKDSSMRVAINLVKEGRAGACISAGNTGALMAISRFVLKTLPGIDRPAIITTIPAIGGHTHMLDLGANVGCTAEHLHQFALMGSVLVNAVDGIEQPRIGLLNIGSEELKGNEEIRDAAKLIQASNLNYIGFVEGNEIYTDRADVVVCDGFAGNVSLKTSEGVARIVSHYLKQEFSRTLLNRMVGLLALPILKAFRQRIDPRKYNGASLLGLQGVVIKSHGGADAVAFANAIEIARLEIRKAVPSMIGEKISTLLPQEKVAT
ncbi:MAG: phosphate acyltransferase PlsX [Gammaproteobacteria bacterium]|nr:phosphate acyltransferase PlsX [Gammaproteobacteria bacterium]